MRTRILTALVALCVLIPALIFSHTWFFPVMVAVCCCIGLGEMLKCVGTLKRLWISVPLMVLGVFQIISIRVACDFWDYRVSDYIVKIALPIMLIELLYLLCVLVFSKGKISVESVTISGFMAAYIVAAFSAIVLLRDSAAGAYTYLLIFIGAWITDIFAYFVGLLFGKHKLIPEISPKKTVEGSIGGTLFCGLAFVLYGVLVGHFVENAQSMNLILMFLYGVAVSFVSQIGDLSLSALKRHYGIKDFGKIFPGHGGVLDRFDSILAVALVLFVLNGFSSVFK